MALKYDDLLVFLHPYQYIKAAMFHIGLYKSIYTPPVGERHKWCWESAKKKKKKNTQLPDLSFLV